MATAGRDRDSASAQRSPEELRALATERHWYHTMELAPGVETAGWYDCRTVAQRIVPGSCEGMRCLDVGTFDGFWAFEMERRGAAEVVAIDILDESRWDWPARATRESREAIARRKGGGDGFLLAAEALGSKVERRDASVYDLDPESFGHFDRVYLGSLLWHLRDPVLALERVRSVCSGILISTDAVSFPLTWLVPAAVATLDGLERPYWWKPNKRGYRRMVEAAGFDVVSGPRLFAMPPGPGHPRVKLEPRTVRTRAGRELLFTSRFGDPHAQLLARPASL